MSETENDSMSLAKKLFSISDIEYELECEVSKALGFSDPDHEHNDIIDYGWDYYDASLEIVRRKDSQFMSREQADKILKLGFYMIYESIGDKCIIWTANGTGTASVRTPNEKPVLKIKPLVWEDGQNSYLFSSWTAKTPFGDFVITRETSKGITVSKAPFFWADKPNWFMTVGDAKSACQDEYQRRAVKCFR